jgi:DNA-binding XRE family transcriptional regulator
MRARVGAGLTHIDGRGGPKQRGTAEVHVFAVNPMDLKKAMATNVRRARHAKEMTQEELADRAGLSARYLGSIKHAKVSASVTVLGRLAHPRCGRLRIDPYAVTPVTPRWETEGGQGYTGVGH